MKAYIFATLVIGIVLGSAPLIIHGQTVAGEKRAGVTRIGLIDPDVQLNLGSDRTSPTDAVADALASLIASERVEVVRLQGRSSLTVFKEARDKACDMVLRVTLHQRKSKPGGNIFDRLIDRTADSAVGEAARRIPMVRNVPGTVGREATVGATQEVTKLEITIKNKDSFVLDLSVSTPSAKRLGDRSLKAEAKKDNDDEVLIPLIESAAAEVIKLIPLPKP